MSLDILDGPAPYHGTRPCTLKLWMDTLPDEQRASVRAALLRPDSDPAYWSTPALQAELADAGWTGSQSVVYKHRHAEACRSCR